MDKFHITDGQWYWDVDESTAINDFEDTSTLYERGKYLVEVIDKIPNKATYKDILAIPNGKQVITWGPSSGKTTAIRQFLYKGASTIYCTKTILEADKMYYDVQAMFEYTKQGLSLRNQIVKFHSKTSDIELSDLPNYSIIICTHERLFIEPQYLLLSLSPEKAYINGSINRRYLLIDEYPKDRESYTVTDNMVAALGLINMKSNNTDLSEDLGRLRRFDTIKSIISKSDESSDIYDKSVKSMLPTLINKKLVPISNASVDRVAFFASNVMNQIVDDNLQIGDKAFYSLIKLPIENIYLFDGTGDISFKGSRVWNIYKDTRFNRSLKLSKPVEFLKDTTVERYIKSVQESTDIIDRSDKFVRALLPLFSIHKKILIYTWKNFKITKKLRKSEIKDEFGVISHIDDTDTLESMIRNSLTPECNKQLEFIHYQSGKDRATNEFSDCDAIVVLGKFFIPGTEIKEFNMINQSSISNIDNMNSLLIQAIYRTRARKGKEISIYFSDDYNIDDVRKLFYNYSSVICNGFNYRKIVCSNLSKSLIEKFSKIYKLKNQSISITELSSILDYTKNNKTYEFLNKLGITYSIDDSKRPPIVTF